MLDLKALLDTHESISQNRKQKGIQYCQAGYRDLSEAEKSGFQNKELLKQAAQHFIQAIRQERTQVEAYIGLAYLLLLISDLRAAEAQLKVALRLSPENPDIKALLEYCLHQRLGLKTPVRNSLARESEQRYTQLQSKIQGAIQTWSQRSMPLEPTCEPEPLARLQANQQELSALWLSLDQELRELEHDMQILSLRRQAQPLQSLLWRLEKIIHTSRHFQTLQQTIQLALQEVQQSSAHIQKLSDKQQIQHFEQTTLEQYLDQCDHLADQLDALSSQGHDIRVLEQPYERLVAAIEYLQDLLDEHLQQLGS